MNQDTPAPLAVSDRTAGGGPWARPKVMPGAGLDWAVVLRDVAGYPFAVGTVGGQVVMQVAATAPRGTIRLSDEHVAAPPLTLAETAARARQASPPPPEAGGAR